MLYYRVLASLGDGRGGPFLAIGARGMVRGFGFGVSGLGLIRVYRV